MPLITVIVPIYNAENYLDKCICSIINQSYTNFELLLINDGSTDNSEAICNKYALNDKRIKVYDIENHGVGHARNVGIQQSKGEWLAFVDSDDYLGDSDYLSHLIKGCSYAGTDLCITKGYIKSNKERNVFTESGCSFDTGYILKHIVGYNDIYLSPWGRLYKSSLIKSYNIEFPEDFHYAEDCCFNLEYMLHVSKPYIADTSAYYYRENVASITHSYRPYHHYLLCLEKLFSYYPMYRKFYDIKEINDYFIGFHLVGNSLSILQDLYDKPYKYKERKLTIRELRGLFNLKDVDYRVYCNNYVNRLKLFLLRTNFPLLNFLLKVRAACR